MNGSPFSAHSDLLSSTVSVDNSAQLLEECKARGKAACAAQAWPDAVRLYSKALECTSEQQQTAILQSNLSLAYGQMNQWKESAEAASKATASDGSYMKGWWRQAQAESKLTNYSKALEALQKGLELEPSNKAFLKEVDKVKAMADKATAATEAAPAENTTTKSSPPKKAASNQSNKQPTTSDSSMKTSEADGVEFSKSEPVRGYKIVNGKKTSYFHNELSEDAARLIGDIKPKQIENPGDVATRTAEGTSAWNQAGTWEEADCSKKATVALEQTLVVSSGPVILSGATVEGTASVVRVRGKQRFMYEMTKCFVDYKAGNVTGRIDLDVIDASCVVGEPYDVMKFTCVGGERKEWQPKVEGQVFASIDKWATLFPDGKL